MLGKFGEIFLIKKFIRTEVKEIKSPKNVPLYFYQLHSCAFTALETYMVYGEINVVKKGVGFTNICCAFFYVIQMYVRVSEQQN